MPRKCTTQSGCRDRTLTRPIETGSTISCLWPALPDHARMPVMLPRESDSDMCRDGSSADNKQRSYPVDEPGRVHGVPDLDDCAEPRALACDIKRFTAMKEKRRWRIPPRNPPQIRGQDKSAHGALRSGGCFCSAFCRVLHGAAYPCTLRFRVSALKKLNFLHGARAGSDAGGILFQPKANITMLQRLVYCIPIVVSVRRFDGQGMQVRNATVRCFLS